MKLSDRFTQLEGRVYLTGIQALVRLPMDQVRLDCRAGLNTGVFISGYEGSPLGGYDLALNRVLPLLAENNIHFRPGVNEDLAATSVMGSQIFQVFGKGKVDGVTGIWYGKGPGVDRSVDILRHANLAGSPGNCAAILLAGDDHLCKSSSIPHQSDFSLYSAAIPILVPGNTQEILDYGLYAIALSRFSGAWVALKLVTNVCDGGGTADVDLGRRRFNLPEGYSKKTDPRLVPPFSNAMELEVNDRRLAAVRDFVRLNALNRVEGAGEGAWLGIAVSGKTYYDLKQALQDCGVPDFDLASLGVRIAKFAVTFPLEPDFVFDFARGLERILVIEEKRSFLELQIRELLYNAGRRPVITGKQDEHGRPLFPSVAELDPDTIACILGPILMTRHVPEAMVRRLRTLDEIASRPRAAQAMRLPNFCSGCPHNRSTILLEGQAAGGGIGCHGMAVLLGDAGRGYSFSTHMGGEGAPWIGMAPFVDRGHIFQNIGDGTYFHSGSLAISATIAAGVNITYKILYNGHVAMTGGQEIAGEIPVAALTRKLEAEGVRRIVVLAEDPSRHGDASLLGRNTEVRDRADLPQVLRELETVAGVSVLIYDQECAAEKRRRRSRGEEAEPLLRLMINEEVCEGCGDCIRQSNCMSLRPVMTPLGEKVRIHQPSCNKDYSCALGDCPSFVTVKLKPGTGLRRPALPDLPEALVPHPERVVSAGEGYRILSPGIGGTGVVTVNALLATAALLDGLTVITLDQTGLAQKGGAVVSHLVLSEQPIAASARINSGNADLILGFDLMGAAHHDNLRCARPDRTAAVINTGLAPTADSIRQFAVTDPRRFLHQLASFTCAGRNVYVDASRLAEGLFGSHLFVNIFLVGAAWQAGLIPVTLASFQQAIRLNGVEVERNLQAFHWGRKYHVDAAWVESHIEPAKPAVEVDEHAAHMSELTAWQNAAWARRYDEFVNKVRRRQPELAATVARYLFKLMTYKDEYEVARLLTKPGFRRQIDDTWEAVESIAYNLHPPLMRRLGVNRKIQAGGWFRVPLAILARMKILRGTPFDIFGYSLHRRLERDLVGWYMQLVEQLLDKVNAGNLPQALEIAALPDRIRGYEAIKEAAMLEVQELAGKQIATL